MLNITRLYPAASHCALEHLVFLNCSCDCSGTIVLLVCVSLLSIFVKYHLHYSLIFTFILEYIGSTPFSAVFSLSVD